MKGLPIFLIMGVLVLGLLLGDPNGATAGSGDNLLTLTGNPPMQAKPPETTDPKTPVDEREQDRIDPGNMIPGMKEITADDHSFPLDHNPPAYREPMFQNDAGMKFVRISPGSFLMGSPTNEPGAKENEELHPYSITKPFYMQITEVTQRQWEMVMGQNPAFFQDLCGPDCPIEKVSWFEAQEFVEILNQKYPHPHLVYRLPYEAEWEYAARAGTQKALYNGDLLNPYNQDFKLDKIAWYWDNSNKRPHPVAQKEPNAWGLFDMLGNVWEWCQEWYDVRYIYGLIDNVEEPSGDKLRVVRGGGWYSFAWRNRCASRDGAEPHLQNGDVGFRLVAEQRPNSTTIDQTAD
ncbi:formylglycine-generating enzyme family protein [bacterium]|nr:formylglycine-generating enzyme family protein [bacterium]